MLAVSLVLVVLVGRNLQKEWTQLPTAKQAYSKAELQASEAMLLVVKCTSTLANMQVNKRKWAATERRTVKKMRNVEMKGLEKKE